MTTSIQKALFDKVMAQMSPQLKIIFNHEVMKRVALDTHQKIMFNLQHFIKN
jgi:hypothetical protein